MRYETLSCRSTNARELNLEQSYWNRIWKSLACIVTRFFLRKMGKLLEFLYLIDNPAYTLAR